MQWLIDLIAEKVIETIGVPPCYIDRGDHGPIDWDITSMIVDGADHDLDMSSIIPAGATAVNLHLVGASTTITDIFLLRPKSHPRVFGSCTIRPQIAGHDFGERRVVGVDPDRIMTYKFTGVGWTNLKINVKGWWL